MEVRNANINVGRDGLIRLTITVKGDGSLIAEDIACLNEKPEEWELILRKKKKARSLDANGYAWVLIDKIAKKIGSDKITVYRETIRQIPGVSTVVCCLEKAKDDFRREWENHGIGWQVEEMPSKLEGCVNLICYYGSSTYTGEQMSVFIDRLMDECKTLHISTMTPLELEALKRGEKC
jgi:hypothetical protein